MRLGQLFVGIDDRSLIMISPSVEITSLKWNEVVHYWASGDLDALRNRCLSIPVEAFYDKAEWLRDTWKAQGGEIVFHPSVSITIKNHRQGMLAFKKLWTLKPDRYVGKTIQVPGLVPTRHLTDEQHENILCLLDMDNGANFSVPGAGKTLTALSVWKILRFWGRLDKALIVCPRSAFESWRDELGDSFQETANFEIYANQLISSTTDICLVNYEKLEDDSRVSYLRQWVINNRALLVVDEAHRIKGGTNSIRWNAVKSLSNIAMRTDVLTGTPMPQGPGDLTAIFSVTWPRLSRNTLDESTLTRMKRKTAFVRTTKDELDLPIPDIRTISETPGPLQKEILSALHDRYLGSFQVSIADQRNLARRGKAVMTMLAAATNPGLLESRQFNEFEMSFSWPPLAVTEDKELNTLVKNYLLHEMPWKFKYVAMRAQELANEGAKVLVWSSFIGNIAALKVVLSKFNPAVIYGRTLLHERESELARFRFDPNCTVLLSNPQTLGEGISLHQHCHAEIFVDRTYNAGLYLQAVDRIHRLGLKPNQSTQIEILQTEGSIDDRVGIRLETKIRALATFLQDKKLTQTALPQDDAFAPIDILGLSDEDFADIVNYWSIKN